MINENWVIAGALLNAIGTVSYLIPTLKGKVKPNKVTWFLWAVAPLIAFAAQISQGVGLSALMTFMVGFGPLLIFSASFLNKKAFWRLTSFDLACGALSVIGLALWLVIRIGNIAILFSILADGLAALPTVRKAWLAPETEDYRIFLFSAISALITLLAIRSWAFAYSGFPLYLLIICSLLIFIILFKPRQRIHPSWNFQLTLFQTKNL